MSLPTPSSLLSNHHILITGGTGLVGNAIIHALLAAHPSARITILDITQPAYWRPPAGRADIRVVACDVTHEAGVRAVFAAEQPSVVIHTAGVVPTGKDRYAPSRAVARRVWDINVGGTRNVVRACEETACVRVLLFTGSCTMVTDAHDFDYPGMTEETRPRGRSLVYGETKGIAESLVLAANRSRPTLITCSLRPSVILGPGDYQLIPTIHRCIAKGETPFVIGGAHNLYDFVYVGNVADAHVLALEKLLRDGNGDGDGAGGTAAGQAFFISNGEPLPFRDFCLRVWSHFGHVPRFTVRVPVVVAWLVALLLEFVTWVLGRDTTISRGSVKDYVQTAYADIGKARRVLGYEPRVKLEEALKISCDEYRERLERAEKGDKCEYGSKFLLAPNRPTQHWPSAKISNDYNCPVSLKGDFSNGKAE